VSAFFVDPARRDDADLLARLASRRIGYRDHARPQRPGSRGVLALRAGILYARPRLALVMALHGGSGNGRGFLWSWLRDARSFGAILVAPTATADFFK